MNEVEVDQSDGRPQSERAYERLQRMIVEGRLSPGSRFTESALAEKLDMSRTPVREAIQRLRQEGYVKPSGGGRARPVVAPLTKEDARELLYLIGAVEGLAVRGAGLLDDDERADLVEEITRINDSLAELSESEEPDRDRFFELDKAFHQTYVEAGAGPRVLDWHESIKPQAERYIRVYVSARRYEIGTSVSEHRRIILAIEAGDPDWAEEAVVNNWRSAANRLQEDIEMLGERGSW